MAFNVINSKNLEIWLSEMNLNEFDLLYFWQNIGNIINKLVQNSIFYPTHGFRQKPGN